MSRITYILPYLETGGTEQHVLNLARVLKGRHEVVLAAPPGPLAERFAAEGIEHLVFPRFDHDLVGGIRGFRRAIRELRARGADLFHVHAAIELALLSRMFIGHKPLILTIHGFFGGSAPMDYRNAAWVANRAVDRVVCVSHIEEKKLVGLGLRPEKAAVVWNGVPRPAVPTPADIEAFREKYQLDQASTVIGAIGRLEKQKGLEYLIEAASALKARGVEATILLVGDGRERGALASQAESLGVRVIFAGFLGERERDAALASIDVYAMPSIGEALPLACIEAMGAGKAIVATTVGGIPEIVADGESGFLVAPRDSAAFADRLGRFCLDPELRRRHGESARAFFEADLTHQAMADKTDQVYQQLLRK